MKKRAFVRYSKQGKIVPGSLILTGGSYPQGPALWKEVPADLCCNSVKDYTCCIAIQVVPEAESELYELTFQTRNGGPNLTGTIHWSSTESETFSFIADGNDHSISHFFGDTLVHTVYLCIDNPSQIRDFEIGFGPGTAVAISNLQLLQGIDEWDGDDMAFRSLDFTGLTSVRQIYNQNTGLQHINITGCVNLDLVELEDNDLTEASVDHVLITLDNSGLTGGSVDLSGGTNSTPSATGLAAETSLVGKGWSVTYNP